MPAAMEVSYGITDAWDDLVEAIKEISPTIIEGVNQRVTELSTTFDLESNMIYAMIEAKRDDQALQRARFNRLFRDRRYHAHTASLIEGEARASRMPWAQSMDASDAAHYRVIALRTQTQLTAALGRIQILEAARVLTQPKKMAPKRTTRANPTNRTTTTTTSMTDAQLEVLIEQGVAKALAARDADRNSNDDDNHVSGTGVVEFTQWFEKMEIVFHISNCYMENQIKFSTCTLLGSALTWWNSHVITVGPDFVCAMTWVDLKKKMTDKYYPRDEMKKLKRVQQMSTLLITRGAMGRVRSLLVMSVDPRDISRRIIQSLRITTVVLKVEMPPLQQ
nr:hypothetical protein [Tanacetum cinerariifolium]